MRLPRATFDCGASSGGLAEMRKGLAIAGAVAALTIAGYVVAWLYGASRLEEAVLDWTESIEGAGLSIIHDQVRIGGFPLALTAVVPNLRLRDEVAGVTIKAAPVTLRTRLWTPNRIAYDISGKHDLVVSDGVRTRYTTLTIGTGVGEVEYKEERRFDWFSASDLRFAAEQGFLTITAVKASSRTLPRDKDPATLTYQSSAELLEIGFSNLFGVQKVEPIERMRLEIAMSGPVMEIFESGTLVDWAEAGGVLTVRDLTLEWGGLAVTATGSGGFDSELRVSGTLTLVSSGFQERLVELARTGALPTQMAGLLHALAEPYIVPAADGGLSQLIVPVTAREGLLSVGGEPVAVIPSLDAL